MGSESIEASFLSIYALVVFFIFLIISKLSHKIYNGILLDKDFLKPQAFHDVPITRSGGIGVLVSLSVYFFIYYLLYSKILFDYLSQYKSKLSETSLSRLEKNPMRILDSKDEQDKEILLNAPVITENLSQKSSQYFNKVKELLELVMILKEHINNLLREMVTYINIISNF